MSSKIAPYLSKFLHALLILAAYGYLAYVLLRFEHYDALGLHFRQAGWQEWGALLLCIALFPLNIGAEAWKWQTLLRDLAPLSFRESMAQVYYGCVGAFLTPQRLGDYPTRVTRIASRQAWGPAILRGFIGSLALTLVNLLFGLIALAIAAPFSAIKKMHAAMQIGLVILVVLLLGAGLLAILYILLERWPKLLPYLRAMKEMRCLRCLAVLGQSACRYLIYCTQLLLALSFCGITPTHQMLLAIPIYYLFVTITPTLPTVDLAVRGSIGVFALSHAAGDATVAIAVALLWLINTILPMLVGTFIHKKSKMLA